MPPGRAALDASLLDAARRGDADAVRAALAAGANVEAKGGRFEQTSLSLAAEKGAAEVVELLLRKRDNGAKGANVGARSKDGYTALFYAARAGAAECVRVLMERGAEAGAKEKAAAKNDATRQMLRTKALSSAQLDARPRAEAMAAQANAAAALDGAPEAAEQQAPAAAADASSAAAAAAEASDAPSPLRKRPPPAALQGEPSEADAASFDALPCAPPPPTPMKRYALSQPVPPDIATWLAGLSLSSYGAPLCARLGVAFVSDMTYVTDDDLDALQLRPLERRRFRDAAAAQRSGGGAAADAARAAAVAAAARAPDVTAGLEVLHLSRCASTLRSSLGLAFMAELRDVTDAQIAAAGLTPLEQQRFKDAAAAAPALGAGYHGHGHGHGHGHHGGAAGAECACTVQ
jgi:hypothetical protein